MRAQASDLVTQRTKFEAKAIQNRVVTFGTALAPVPEKGRQPSVLVLRVLIRTEDSHKERRRTSNTALLGEIHVKPLSQPRVRCLCCRLSTVPSTGYVAAESLSHTDTNTGAPKRAAFLSPAPLVSLTRSVPWKFDCPLLLGSDASESFSSALLDQDFLGRASEDLDSHLSYGTSHAVPEIEANSLAGC